MIWYNLVMWYENWFVFIIICELKEMDEPIIEEDGVDKPRADVERMDE